MDKTGNDTGLFDSIIFESEGMETLPRKDQEKLEDDLDDKKNADADKTADNTSKAKPGKFVKPAKQDKEPVIKNPLEEDGLTRFGEDVLSNDENGNDGDDINHGTEEGEEKTKRKPEENKPPKGKTNANSSSPYSAFAETLAERGLFSDFTKEKFGKYVEEEGDPIEALIRLNRETIESNVENWKNEMEESTKEVFEAIESGVDMDEFIKVKQSENRMIGITPEKLSEDIELQKQIVGEGLRLRGYTKDEIKEELKLYEDTDKLADKAKLHHKKLQEYHSAQKKRLEQEALQREQLQRENIKKMDETVKRSIGDLNEIIPGVKLNKQAKDDIYKSMSTVVGHGKNGNPLTSVAQKREQDPVKFDILLHYFNQIGLFDGKFNKLTTAIKSGAVKDFKSMLENNEEFRSHGTEQSRTPEKTEKSMKTAFDSALQNFYGEK